MSDRFLRDTVAIYPKVTVAGRRDAVETDGEPVRFACSVQPDSVDRKAMKEVANADRFGQMATNILFAERPTVPIGPGTKIVHVANRGVDLAEPDVYAAMGKMIPPGAGRARWTVLALRNS